MNWQEQARLNYQQQLAEKERLKQQTAEQQRNLLKAQFEAQARIATEQVAERERQSEEQRNREQQQQTAALQRIANDLQLSNEQREARQREARERLKQLGMQQQKVWIGWDSREFRSPREQEFWNAWKACGYWDEIPIIPQHHIGRYWVDFADPVSLTVIEIDGRAYHTDRYAFTHDRIRERALKKLGWDVIRFSADEVTSSIDSCLDAAYEFIKERRSNKRTQD